jgi:outer membrane protein TolC
MLSLPLAVVGALLAILVTGNNLGMPAMIGMVMLMGLVTKNAILLIDMTNHYVREGLSVEDAILTAGPIRLRPILMTTMAMILGMLPSALGRGEGGEFRAPISIATIGGLVTSTGLTLVVVPVAYLLLARFVGWFKVARQNPSPAVRSALRVTGALLAVVALGWFLTAASAFGQEPPPQPILSLTFEDALAYARNNNQSLKVTEEQVRESQARVAASKADFLPRVDLNFQYTPAQRFPLIRVPAGIFGPDEQTFEANFTRENIMQLQIDQPLYTGGRLSNAYGIQAASLDASRLDLERARQQLEFRVVEAFYRALMSEQGVRVAEQQIAFAEKQLELAKARFAAGSVARLDVLQAEVELANSKARRIQATAAVETSHQALRTVLSLPQSQRLELRGTLDERPAQLTRSTLEQLLPSRPDLQAFSARRDVAQHTVNLANAEWKPSLSFTGNVQYQEDGFSRLLNNQNQSYTFGLALRVPLFATPGTSARRGVAQAQMRQTEHGLRAATDDARLELESAWTEFEASDEIVATQEKALELARESVAIAQVSYENGVITSAELNDAQVRLLLTEWNLMQAKYGRIVAAAKARMAAGAS